MENISGWSRTLAKMMVDQQVNKPFIGKPYIKYGQVLALGAYFFQLGGILASKHTENLDEFGPAFLGMRGDVGAVKKFFELACHNMVNDFDMNSLKFLDYVTLEFIRRIKYNGNSTDFFLEYGTQKISPESAMELVWQYSEQGATLGAIKPSLVREIFTRTYMLDQEKWAMAHKAGLNIPQEQENITYEEAEELESSKFMIYCENVCPEIHSVLKNSHL